MDDGEGTVGPLLETHLTHERGQSWLSRELTARGIRVSQPMVSKWVRGEKPLWKPRQVMACEEVLGLEPGTLSRVLGWVSASAVPALDPESAIRHDHRLRPRERDQVLAYLQGLVDAG